MLNFSQNLVKIIACFQPMFADQQIYLMTTKGWSVKVLVTPLYPTLTPWTIAHQSPLSIGFPRQDYWSRLPFPSPGVHNPGIKPVSCLCGSCGTESASNAGDPDSIPGLGRSPEEGSADPLQYSCLENSMDRGAWWLQSMGSQRVRQD